MGTRHLHEKTYPGEDAGRVVVQWLNTRTRKAAGGDPVERLLESNLNFLQGDEASARKIRSILNGAGLYLHPTFGSVARLANTGTPVGWDVQWMPVRGKLRKAQALALYALLTLGSQEMRRVRPCPRCGRYFFQRFRSQRFDSERCQKLDFQNRPEAAARRREYMRRLRQRRRQEEELRQLKRRKS